MPQNNIKTASIFQCCHYCVPPKRYPGCHDHCPERAAEKAEYDKRKAESDRKRKAISDIYRQRSEHVEKALKKKRRRNL